MATKKTRFVKFLQQPLILSLSFWEQMKDALRKTSDGVILDLEISPGAKETSVHGYNPWRRRIEVRISEKAQKGKANAELISFFSGLFKVNTSNIQIIKGLASSKKSVKIIGAEAPEILEILIQK